MKKIARLLFALSVVLMFSSPMFLLAQQPQKPEIIKIETHTRDRFLSATVWIKSEIELIDVSISFVDLDFGSGVRFELESPNIWRADYDQEMEEFPPGVYTATAVALDKNLQSSDWHTFTFKVLQNTYLPIVAKP